MATPGTATPGTATSAAPRQRRHPRNPWLGLYFTVLFFLPAILGAAALVDQFSRVVGHEMSGQRTEGFVLFTPFILALVGVLTAVRAVRAFRPWFSYRAVTDPAVRRADMALDLARQPRVPLAAFGGVALAGWIVLLLLHPNNLAGRLLLWEFQLLMLLAWTGILGLLVQTIYYSRFLPETLSDPGSAGDVTPGNPARDTL